MDYKSGVQNAMKKYHSKQLNQGLTRESRGKYKKPEKDTEKQVMAWAKEAGLNLHVIEASTYNSRTGTFGDAKVQAGFSDLVGNTSHGLACYIELKAKDRRSNLSDSQREFLIEKVEQGCFAVVVDSRDRVERYWKQFCSLKNLDERKSFLMECLPKKRTSRKNERDAPLF